MNVVRRIASPAEAQFEVNGELVTCRYALDARLDPIRLCHPVLVDFDEILYLRDSTRTTSSNIIRFTPRRGFLSRGQHRDQ